MFLTAMARPRVDQQTGVWWDGKIGTWCFAEQVPAQRNSINRPAGTLETKTINVTWEVTVHYYINHLFPTIVAILIGGNYDIFIVAKSQTMVRKMQVHM